MLRKLLRLAALSLQSVLIASVLSVLYGLLVRRVLTADYIFNANFALGAGIIAVGLIQTFMPVSLTKDKLADHSTYAVRHMEQKEKKRQKAAEILHLGIFNIIITGLAQLIWFYAGI